MVRIAATCPCFIFLYVYMLRFCPCSTSHRVSAGLKEQRDGQCILKKKIAIFFKFLFIILSLTSLFIFALLFFLWSLENYCFEISINLKVILYIRKLPENIVTYYSINSRDAHIWSGHPCYPSSVHNRYPAIYVHVVCQDLFELFEVLHNHKFSSCKMHFVDNLLNNKTIILLNFAEYHLISQLVLWPRRLSIRRFHRIIVK